MRTLEIYRFENAESFPTPEGIITPIYASKKVAVMHIKLPAGLKVEPHSHDEDGILMVTKGSFRLTGDETIDLKSGDLVYVPEKVSAGIECDEDSEAVMLSVPSSYENVEALCSIMRSFFGSGNGAAGGA
jgi:quercetin dioxygenase-like cupin family protein